ncbi:hypothetical protein BDN67DRAFT_969004, partial [Paxillus ammoniavirescens]
MQCTTLREIDYLDIANILVQQREVVKKWHIVYQGLPQLDTGYDYSYGSRGGHKNTCLLALL